MLRDERSAADVVAHDSRRPTQGDRGSGLGSRLGLWRLPGDWKPRLLLRAGLNQGSMLRQCTDEPRLPAVGPHKVLRTHVSGQTVVVQTQGEALPWSARHLLPGATASLASPALLPFLL